MYVPLPERELRAVLVFFYASGSYYYYQTFLTRYRIRPQLAWTMLPFVIGTASLVAARGIASGPDDDYGRIRTTFLGALACARAAPGVRPLATSASTRVSR